MLGVLRCLCEPLCKYLCTAIYHPQTDGLVEKFNKMLKGMLRVATQGDPQEWDQLLSLLVFALREVPGPLVLSQDGVH